MKIRTRALTKKEMKKAIDNFLNGIEDYNTTLLIIKDVDGDFETIHLLDTVCDTLDDCIIIQNELIGTKTFDFILIDTLIWVDYSENIADCDRLNFGCCDIIEDK